MNNHHTLNRPIKTISMNYLFPEREEFYVCDEPPTYNNYTESKSGFWIWHVNENRLLWSNDLCRMMGVTRVTSGFEQWIELLSPEDLMIFSATLENTLRDFKTRKLDFRIKTEKKEKTINCRIECILEPDTENILEIIGLCQDITEDNLLQPLQIKEQLRRQEEINRKLLMIISHDLRTPFNCVLGLAELLLQKTNRIDKVKTEYYLKAILSSARNAYSMIVRLTEWAKTHRDNWTVQPIKLNLYELVLEVFEELKTTAETKDIKLVNRITPEFFIDADREILRIILRNLISNAIKFSFKNGEVVVKAKVHNAHYLLSIIDFGIGIEPENAKQIFRSGINGSATGTGGEKGLGIGLSICKELIDKLNGKIWVESELGNGSSFHFVIPVGTSPRT